MAPIHFLSLLCPVQSQWSDTSTEIFNYVAAPKETDPDSRHYLQCLIRSIPLPSSGLHLPSCPPRIQVSKYKALWIHMWLQPEGTSALPSGLILHRTNEQTEAKRSDLSMVTKPASSRAGMYIDISCLPVQCSLHWTWVPVVKWLRLHRNGAPRDGFLHCISFGKISSWISLSALKSLHWVSGVCGHLLHEAQQKRRRVITGNLGG